MKNLALVFSIIVLASGICFAQTSAFTYQGKLASSGAPANGAYQFEFKLFDDALAGTQVGTTQTVPATVTGGAFSTRLDFGATAFPAGADRWLEISVRASVNDPYTVLGPRQQINSVPFAVRSLKATDADNAATANTATTAGNVSGVVAVANGGTGRATQSFVDLTSSQANIGGNKTFTGTISGNGSGLNSLNGGNLNSGSITADKLGAGSVTENALRANNVTTDKIADGAVTTNKILGEAVTTDKLADGSVKATKITDGAVSTSKLEDGSVTQAKLAAGFLPITQVSANVVAGSAASVTVICPVSHPSVVGGGFSATSNLVVNESRPITNSWRAQATNTGMVAGVLTVYAICVGP